MRHKFSVLITIFLLAACSTAELEPVSLHTPEEVVEAWLTALGENDHNAWLATMTEEKQMGFSSNKHGVISMEVHSVEEQADASVIEEYLNSDWAVERGIQRENFTVVYADFTVEYDHLLVPTIGGDLKWIFFLVRDDADSQWLISDYGW